MSDSDNKRRPPLVLVASDQEWSARSLESILGPHGYAVLRAYTGRQALDLAHSAQPDAVILDARLPDIDGVDVCRELRADPDFSATTPVIMTAAGAASRVQRLAVYRAGAWEFCSQPLDGELLLAKLDTFIRCKTEIDRVRDESLLDEHTGLYSMKGLARRATEIGAEAYRRHAPMACVAFSPDAALPAQTDDKLRELVQRLTEGVGGIVRTSSRVSDAVGRVGQTEFAIVAPATEAKGALRLVERLRDTVRATPIELDGTEHTVSIRAGYCAVSDFAESAVDAVEMVLRAVRALRHQRAEGNGTYVTAYEDVAAAQPN
jgi:diguanylate cyclase (GGDEF)-like protein